MAEKDDDVAYAGSDWNDGILPWEYGINLDLDEADPLLRGTVFTDRGVYKLGEDVQFKAILRSNTPGGIKMLPEGTPVSIAVRDSRNKVVDERVIKLNAWSTAEWKMPVPLEGALGNYTVRAILESDRAKPAAQGARAQEGDEFRGAQYGLGGASKVVEGPPVEVRGHGDDHVGGGEDLLASQRTVGGDRGDDHLLELGR